MFIIRVISISDIGYRISDIRYPRISDIGYRISDIAISDTSIGYPISDIGYPDIGYRILMFYSIRVRDFLIKEIRVEWNNILNFAALPGPGCIV